MEHIRDDQLRAMPRNTEPVYYWHIQRKSKLPRKPGKPQQWVFVRDFVGTKANVASLWCKWFRDGDHRLKCILQYPTV